MNSRTPSLRDTRRGRRRVEMIQAPRIQQTIQQCSEGMKCKDGQCRKKHPLCKNDSSCLNSKCGFSHSDGRRYTGAVDSGRTTMCWKSFKCSDPLCELEHPKCKDGSSCSNGKCGFVHPNGWRYTPSVVTCLPVEEMTNDTVLWTPDAAKETIDAQVPLADQRPCVQNAYETGKIVKAKGDVSSVDSQNGIVWMKPTALHQFASHPEFYSAINKCEDEKIISITLMYETNLVQKCIVVGDSVIANVFMDNHGFLHANEVSFSKINFLARDCDDIQRLIKISTAPASMHEDTIKMILSRNELSHDVVATFLLQTQWAWADSTQLRRARRLHSIVMSTKFLLPEGCFIRQLPLLGTRELMAARDMIGCICVLDPIRIPSIVHAARRTASCLGKDGIPFLGDILQALAIATTPDTSLSNYEWWQLPSVPTEQEISTFESRYGVTDIKSLPTVLVGDAYKNSTEYMSTYMRLHRADNFLPFVQAIQKNFNGLQSTAADMMDVVVLERVTVCGIQLSKLTGETDFQLQCIVQNPSVLQHDSLSLTNTLCVSLKGDFKDEFLLWAVISIAPSKRVSVGYRGLTPLPVVFGVRWCTEINGISDDEVFNLLHLNNETARLIENPVSFVSCEPVLNAMRSYWRPGCTLRINFEDTLLRGHAISSSGDEKKKFLKHATALGVLECLDDFQREAFNSVAKHSFALIQGPPGCGKSFVGSRLVQVLASQYRRILVATSKNHSLDELLIDISHLLELDKSRLVRVGNEKKIASDLKPHSLPAHLIAVSDALNNSSEQKELDKLAQKFNMLCKRLRNPVCLTWSNFERFAGPDGTRAILFRIGLFGNEYDSYKSAPPHIVELVNRILHDWAKPVIDYIVRESTNYWRDTKSNSSNNVSEKYKEGALESDLGGFGEIHPNSLLGVITANTIEASQTMIIPEMDSSFMWSWGEESKKNFILLVLLNEFNAITDQFLELNKDLPSLRDSQRELRIRSEIDILQSASVIGATVLGVLLNIDSISASRPEVLILEEAGEVSEAQLISILRIPSLKKCVLIGDHQQLRPTVNCHELRCNKKFDISCFERLVSLKMPCTMLKTQNRMRQEVLLPVQLNYPGIVTNSSLVLPPVTWLKVPLFWWVCEDPGVKQHSSWYNEEQGHRATQLANFLVDQQATAPQRITILVPYSSQQLFVQELLRNKGKAEVIVSTIDQYQGDENDILILTLVRCDHDNQSKIGFLGLKNRMIVATSRQKRALLIIGSEQCFATNDTWKILQDELKHSDSIGPKLPLCCPRHPTQVLHVKDSRCMPHSGCGVKCGATLSCGHKCSSRCHAGDLHGNCKELVKQIFIPCNHERQYQCHAVQQLCPTKVQIKLKCGHSITDTCGRYHSSKETTPECTETCKFRLPCSHHVWLKCGSSIEGYISPEFNACPDCIIPSESRSLLSRNKLNDSTQSGEKSLVSKDIPQKDLEVVIDAVSRENLCSPDLVCTLRIALLRGRIPQKLLQQSIPSDLMWDPTASKDEKRLALEQFRDRQRLWHVLLQESGANIPKDWQKNPLTMLAALAIDCDENRRSNQHIKATGLTKAQIFYSRLCQLSKAQIENPADFIEVLKKADECLYKELSEHKSSKEVWYDKLEGSIAKSITALLLAKPVLSSQNGSQKKVVRNFLHECQGMDTTEESRLNKIRSDWYLPVSRAHNLDAPPYEEVPQDFLYQPALQGLYLSIDLKNADFYVLRMATSMINSGTWKGWVEETVPGIVERIPFIGELKPLRVRVLGKVLHKKNAIMQYHCIRLIVRALLHLASEVEQLHTCIERVFQFSCDELCLKLKDDVALSEAGHLHEILSNLFDQLCWDDVMPVHIEIFRLVMLPIKEGNQRARNRADIKEEQMGDIHPGHPSLKCADQFVDLPAAHDPCWEKPKLPLHDHDGDSYFVRRLYSRSSLSENNYTIEMKMLSKGLRPLAILQFMSSVPKEDNDALGSSTLSTDAKEFVPVAAKFSPTAPIKSPQKPSKLQANQGPSETPILSVDTKEFFPGASMFTQHRLLSSNAAEFVPYTPSVCKGGQGTTVTPILLTDAEEVVPAAKKLTAGAPVFSPQKPLSSDANEFVPNESISSVNESRATMHRI